MLDFLIEMGKLGILSWLGFELRQWRIWYMNNHGKAPDS